MPRKYRTPSPVRNSQSSRKYKSPPRKYRESEYENDKRRKSDEKYRKDNKKSRKYDSDDDSDSEYSSLSEDDSEYSSNDTSSSSDSEEEMYHKRKNQTRHLDSKHDLRKNKDYKEEKSDKKQQKKHEQVRDKNETMRRKYHEDSEEDNDERLDSKHHSLQSSKSSRRTNKIDTSNDDENIVEQTDENEENEAPRNIRQRKNVSIKDSRDETPIQSGPPKYRVVSFNGEELTVRKMYTSNIGPKNAAQKAFNKMCDKLNEKMEITVERMGDNKGKVMTYFFMKQELDPPIEREIAGKKVVYRHKTVSC